MTEIPTQPTTTHTCPDGKIRPGKGFNGKGADKCSFCVADYHQKRRARLREAKYAGPSGVVGQAGLNRGNIVEKHGFYTRKLKPKEAKLAAELHAAFRDKYTLDNVADDMLLMSGIVNYVKSLRPEPDQPGDKNVRDYQSYYEREFRDIMKTLSLTPKERREKATGNEVADAINELFGRTARKAQEPESSGKNES